MDSLKEKRVTYQDGECRDPIFLSDSKRIVYASTTDELKENPLLLHPSEASASYPMTDLYSSDLSGSDIQRLTQQNGFDGFAWPRPDRPQSIIFSRLVDNRLATFQLNLESRQSIPLLAKKDVSIESLRLSPDKKQWIWIERDKTGATQVLTAPYNFSPSKQQPLGLPAGDYKEILWISPQKILLTAKIQKKYVQFYTWDFEKKCLQGVFDSNTDVSSPRLHAERQGLVYASTSNGVSQIFYKSLPTSTTDTTCLGTSPDSKTK
jgi:Tol biopolymer transport system component